MAVLVSNLGTQNRDFTVPSPFRFNGDTQHKTSRSGAQKVLIWVPELVRGRS